MTTKAKEYKFVFDHLRSGQDALHSNSSQNLSNNGYDEKSIFAKKILESERYSKTSNLAKSLSTPNLDSMGSIGNETSPCDVSLENIEYLVSNTLNSQNIQENNFSNKLQNLQFNTKSSTDSQMTSTEKKGYQYYFKKNDQSEGRQLPNMLPPEVKTQPYIMYGKYDRAKLSNDNNGSVNKSTRYERSNVSIGLDKRTSLYSSGYTPARLQQHRQPSIEDTTEKYKPKFITPGHSPLIRDQGLVPCNADRVKEFSSEEIGMNPRIQQMSQSQSQQKFDESTKKFQSVDLRNKTQQLDEFFNQTLGNPNIAWNEQKKDDKKELINSPQTPLQNPPLITSYFNEIQKFKSILKSEEMAESCVFTVNDTLESSEKLETPKKLEKNDRSKTCLECLSLKSSLSKAQAEIAELDKKRKSNIDQILRQQKAMKEVQESEARLKKQLADKQHVHSEQRSTIEALIKSEALAKAELTSFQIEFHAKLQSQLSNLQQQHEKRLQSQTQKISHYLSHISRLDKQIEETEKINKQKIDEMRLMCESKIKNLKMMGEEEVQKVKQELMKMKNQQTEKLIEQHIVELQVAKDSEEQIIAQMKSEHELKMNKLTAEKIQQVSALTNQISSLQTSLQQLPTLFATIETLQKQLLAQKTLKYSSQKQLASLITKFQQLEKSSHDLKQRNEESSLLLGDKQVQISMLNEIRQKLQSEVLRSEEVINGMKVRLVEEEEKFRQSDQLVEFMKKEHEVALSKSSQLQNELIFYRFMTQALKQTTQKPIYSTIQTRIKQIISTPGSSIDQISKQLLHSQSDVEQADHLTEESSISPSTSGHVKCSKKKVMKEKEAQLGLIKELRGKLLESEARVEEMRKRLEVGEGKGVVEGKGRQGVQEKLELMKEQHAEAVTAYENKLEVYQVVIDGKDHQIDMLKTKISTLQIQAQNFSQIQKQTFSLLQNKVSSLETVILQKENLISELNLKLIQLNIKLQEKDDLIIENSEVISRLESSLKYLTESSSNRVQQVKEKEKGKGSGKSLINDEIALRSPQHSDHEQDPEQPHHPQTSPKTPMNSPLSSRSQPTRSPQSMKNINEHSQNPLQSFANPEALQILAQQVESKDSQISELSCQLQESFQIIKMLKESLKERQCQAMSNHQVNMHTQVSPQQQQQQQHNAFNLSIGAQNTLKQHQIKHYYTKVQEYYNEILQIFGLDLVSCNDNNTNPHEHKCNSDDNLIAFDHECSPTEDRGNPHSEHLLPTSDHFPPSTTNQFHPQTLTHLSSNQQEVLRIINQWIRKLQRQSISIHQHKQKCHYIQQQAKHLQQENSLLSMEKLQIYDKYQAFVSKLQQENTELQDKLADVAGKLAEVEGYVKELEELAHETSRECMRSGLFALGLAKEHEVGDLKRMYFNPYQLTGKEKKKLQKQPQLLISKKGQNGTHWTSLDYLNHLLISESIGEENNEQMIHGNNTKKKSYLEEFYERHGGGKNNGKSLQIVNSSGKQENTEKVEELNNEPTKKQSAIMTSIQTSDQTSLYQSQDQALLNLSQQPGQQVNDNSEQSEEATINVQQ